MLADGDHLMGVKTGAARLSTCSCFFVVVVVCGGFRISKLNSS